MYALIDVGNTKTKVKVFDTKDVLVNNYVFMTEEIINKKEIFLIKEDLENILFSSVVPSLTKEMKIFFKDKKVLEIKETNFINSLNFDHPINYLGSDLICSYYGIKDIKNNLILISFGTATVISTVKSGIMRVEVIVPGLYTSLKSFNLAIKGFNISYDEIVNDKNNEDETVKVFKNGLLKGHSYMVFGFVNELLEQLDAKNILITGGCAKDIKKYLKFINIETTYCDDLIFNGLKKIYKNIKWN